MKKRIVSIFLATTMLVGLTACGKQTDTNVAKEIQKTSESTVEANTNGDTVVESTDITYPLDTKDTLTLWQNNQLNYQSDYADYSTSPFHTGLEEMTGVEVEWQQPANATAGIIDLTAYNLLLTEEELPDIIYTSMSSSTGQQMIDDGVIYDLTEYLPKYAPDYWEYINKDDYAVDLKSMTTDRGRQYHVVNFREKIEDATYTGPLIRQDWLDECGLEAPVTLEDWENVLRVFKEKYGARFGWFYKRFENPGIGSGVGAYGTFKGNVYLDDNGMVQYAQAQPEFKEYMEVLNRWWDENLIDKDSLTMDDAAVRTKILNNEIGVSFSACSQLGAWIADAKSEGTGAEWVGLAYPRTAEGEPTNMIQTTATGYQGWGAVVTTSCPEEKLITALKWLNYGYTEEGIMYWNYGKEGVSYTIGADGLPQWTDEVLNYKGGITEAAKKYIGTWGTGLSVMLSHSNQLRMDESAVAATKIWTENSVAHKHCLPTLALTEDETIRSGDIQTALTAYVQEMSFKFLTGEASLDDFDAYLEELEDLGLQECLNIYQAAYDRFNSK